MPAAWLRKTLRLSIDACAIFLYSLASIVCQDRLGTSKKQPLETRPALISAGDDAIPRGTWQIDPFGHSNTEAWLLGSEAGFESLYWGRTDYQDVALRTSNAGKDNNQWLEWVWRGSESLGPAADIFAGELTTGQYAAPIDFNDG